jgi:hypothetical protein
MSADAEQRKRAAIMFTDMIVLKLIRLWDPLRGDPRFERIVESLAPKDAASPAK